MIDLISRYPRAFGLALALHLIIGVVFVLNFQFERKVKVNKPVDVVQAVAVNEAQVQEELNKLKAIEDKKRKAEQDRLKKLERDADKARKQREKEQKRLKELEKKRKQEQKKKERLEKERKTAEKKKKEAEKQRKLAEKKKKEADTQRKLAEKQRKLAEEKKRKAEEEARLAEQKRKKEAERRKKEEQLRALEEQERREAEALRQKQMEEEQARLAAQRDKKALKIVDKYQLLIQKSVKNSWREPANMKPGMSCVVEARLMPTGDIISVVAKNCKGGGGEVFKRSVENAVHNAAPLPLPPDKSLFRKYFQDLKFNFVP